MRARNSSPAPSSGSFDDRRHLQWRPLQSSPPALPPSHLAVRIGDQAQNRQRMTPFAVEQIWRAGRPVPVTEKGSTLAE
jgi:hypothetical protein